MGLNFVSVGASLCNRAAQVNHTPHRHRCGRQAVPARTHQKRQQAVAWNLWLDCWTQEEIAQEIGVHQTTVGDWIKDFGTNPIFLKPPGFAAWDLWLNCWSYREIAKEIGVDHTVVGDWVLGFGTNPKFQHPWRLACRAGWLSGEGTDCSVTRSFSANPPVPAIGLVILVRIPFLLDPPIPRKKPLGEHSALKWLNCWSYREIEKETSVDKDTVSAWVSDFGTNPVFGRPPGFAAPARMPCKRRKDAPGCAVRPAKTRGNTLACPMSEAASGRPGTRLRFY